MGRLHSSRWIAIAVGWAIACGLAHAQEVKPSGGSLQINPPGEVHSRLSPNPAPAPQAVKPSDRPAIAPLGSTPEVNGIVVHIEELRAKIASHKEDRTKNASLFAAGSAKAQEHELVQKSLDVELAQAEFDLSQANQRAAISARAINHRENLRSAFDYTHSHRAITSPLYGLQAARHERTGVPIRMMDSLPGPHDPNDVLNQVAHGTSSLRTYQFVPFSRTPLGSASLAQAAHGTLSATADGSLLSPPSSATRGSLDPNPPMGPSVAADQTSAAAAPPAKHSLDFGFQVRPGMIFNSGFVEGKTPYSPANIILNHSADAHAKGQLKFNALTANGTNGILVPIRPQFGYNIADSGNGSAAAHVDMLSIDSQHFNVRTAALRYLNTTEEVAVNFGTMETLFGDLGTAANTTVTGSVMVGTVATVRDPKDPTGAGFTGVPQLRLARYWHNVLEDNDIAEFAFSLEDATVYQPSFKYLQASQKSAITILNRYPTVASRLRYGGANGFDSVQIAGLLTPIGFDTNNPPNSNGVTNPANGVNFHEAFDTALGVSTNARFEIGNHCLRDTIYMGAVGGRGVGSYIFGNLPSAVLSPVKTATQDDIRLVDAFGSYLSYRRVLSSNEKGFWSSNTMFGMAEASHSLPSTASDAINRQLYQAGVNLLWQGGTSAFGIEYQYGSRLVQGGVDSDTRGENHRVMFVLQFTALDNSLLPSGGRSLTSRSTARRAATGNDFNAASRDSRSSKKSKMRF